MNVTEIEAREKVCPLMSNAAVTNMLLCRGSECMLWEKDPPPSRRHLVYDKIEAKPLIDEPPRPVSVPEDWAWVPPDPKKGDLRGVWIEGLASWRSRTTGHCGLKRSLG